MNLQTLQQIMSTTDIHPEEVLLVAADACEEMGLYEVAKRFRKICELKDWSQSYFSIVWKRTICEESLWSVSDKTAAACKQWNEFVREHKRLHQNP